MEPISVRYVITRLYFFGSWWAAGLKMVLVFCGIGAFLIWLGFVTTDSLGGPDLGSIFPGIAFALFILLGIPLLGQWQGRTWIGQSIDLAFSDEGIRQDSFGRHFQGDWSALKSVKRRGGYVLVNLRGSGTLALPVSAFSSRAQIDTLITIAGERIAASKALAAPKG